MIEIIPATIREYSYIAAHVREQDRQELWCQLPEGASSYEVAMHSLSGAMHAYTATYRGNPTAAFGFSPTSLCGSVYSAWLWGTENVPKVVPRIGRYSWTIVAPMLVKDGVRRLEVRSIAGHLEAHRWLAGLGAQHEAKLIDYGRNGEAFELFAWRLSDVRKSDVPIAQSAEAA